MKNNTQITSNSGTVDITSKTDDINITGANISAQDNINLLAENGNVDIESTQDSLFSNNKYNSYTVGGTIGFGVGKDKVETVTNNYTTLETTGTDENGNNTGSVNIATNELIYDNIEDFYKTEQKGFSFSTSVGAGTTDKGSTNLAPSGSTSIGLTSTGQEKEQTTYATLGNGNITIAGNEVSKHYI